MSKLKQKIKERKQDKIWLDINQRLGYFPNLSYISVSKETDYMIMYVLSFMPQEIIKFAADKITFIESREHDTDQASPAYCFHNISDLTEYTVYFDSSFAYYPKDFQYYVIAHEIGHAYLKHYQIDSEEIVEKEADDFAAEYGFEKPDEHRGRQIASFRQFYQEATTFEKITAILTGLAFISIFLLGFSDFFPEHILIFFLIFCIIFGIVAGIRERVSINE